MWLMFETQQLPHDVIPSRKSGFTILNQMNNETTDARRTDQDIYEDVIKANQKRMLKNMNNQTTSDTPETDAAKRRINGMADEWVPRYVSEQLERERDEARASLAAAEAWSATLADVGDDFRAKLVELRNAVRNFRDVQGRHHTQIACERLFAILPENVNVDAPAVAATPQSEKGN